MNHIMSKIFPKSGVTFIRDKCAARAMAGELKSSKHFDRKTQNYINDFDAGMTDGRSELQWFEEDGNYVPHMLTDFLLEK